MIFTPIAGGLGDVLTYFLDGELGYFRAAKRLGYTTKVVVWSVSDQARSVFEGHPDIDEIDMRAFAPVAHMTDIFRSYAASVVPQARLMTDTERAEIPWVRPEFHLTPDEAEIARRIEAGAPYVAVHPFAGKPERDLVRAGIARSVVEAAASDGRRVVVLGGDSLRNGRPIKESFESNNPNVISLVNKFSVRLQAHVASRAAKFIGSVSCYNCVAQSCGVPALVFGSAGNRYDMTHGGSVFKKMRDNGTPVHYLDRRPDLFGDLVREFCRDCR
jgi:hypothetical protein